MAYCGVGTQELNNNTIIAIHTIKYSVYINNVYIHRGNTVLLIKQARQRERETERERERERERQEETERERWRERERAKERQKERESLLFTTPWYQYQAPPFAYP